MKIHSKFSIILISLLLAACAGSGKAPTSTVNQYEKAVEAYKAGRFSDAEPILIRVLEKYPNFAEGWYRLGNLYVRTGQNEAAVNAYKQCVKYDPSFSKAWHNLSLVHLKVAVSVLEEGIENATADPAATNQLNMLREAMLNISLSERETTDK